MADGPQESFEGTRPRASGPAFQCWELPLLELAEFRSLQDQSHRLLSQQQAHYLLRFSVLAPSPHNSVPQAYRLQLDQDRIELWLRRSFVLEASDSSGKEALVGVGCAIENLSVAALQYGVRCNWTEAERVCWPQVAASAAEQDVLLGWLSLAAALPAGHADRRRVLSAMIERRTVRAEFLETEHLSPQLYSGMEAAVVPPVQLRVFTSAAHKFAWGKLDELAQKHKLEEGAFRRELGHWLLANDDEHSTRGMRGREFGLDDAVARELAAQLRGDAPLAVDQIAFMARTGRTGICSSSAICVLTSADRQPSGAIAAGRALQRCLLLATEHGYAATLHTAVCQVPHARAMCQATLLQGGTPDVIFRLGKARNPRDAQRAHSSRPPLEELLLST